MPIPGLLLLILAWVTTTAAPGAAPVPSASDGTSTGGDVARAPTTGEEKTGRAEAASTPSPAPQHPEQPGWPATAAGPAGRSPPAAASGAVSAPAVSAPAGAAPMGVRAATQARDDSMQDLMPLVQDEAPRSRLNLAGWYAAGVTVLLLGVASYYGASAAGRSGDANRLLIYRNEKTGIPQEYASQASAFEDDVRVGRRDDRIAKGLAIAAGVTAIASTVLFLLDGRSAAPAAGETGTSDNGDRAPRPAAHGRMATARRRTDLVSTALPGPIVGVRWSF